MDPYMLSQAPAVPSAFPTGPSPSPLDAAYDFGALAEDRQDAREAAALQHSSASGTQLQVQMGICLHHYHMLSAGYPRDL